jgi:RNA polymerase sigma factor (sigma-70 family)
VNLFKNSRKPDPLNDEELLRQYRQSGDLAVLGELFQAHSSMVYYVCYRYLQDGELSKDAVMQIFEGLITKVNRQEIRQFGKWLYVLSRNHCLMQLRSAKKMKYQSIDDFMELADEWHPVAEEKEQAFTALEICMEKLPAAQKQSIDLFFLNEKCYKEVAVLTGYSLDEVKSYIQNGKRNLKNCMDKNREG